MRAQRTTTTALAAIAVALGLTLAGCASESAPSGDDSAPATSNGQDSGQNGDGQKKDDSGDGDTTQRGADLATTEFAVSWEDAVDTAMENFDGDLAEIELDWNRDRYAYKIELVSQTEEYEVRIDADTGEQFGEQTEKIESDDVAEKTSETIDLDTIVSWDDALATALDAQNGTVNEWKLEGTEHGPQWQFDIDDDAGEDYEVTVDAVSGDLITTDD